MKQPRHTKHFTLTLLMLIITSLFSLFACNEKVEPVVITANFSSYDYELEDKTLKDLMTYLKEDNQLTFESSNGMITSINGKANTTNSFWMLYTDDAELSNTALGTITYNGKTYASASFGFEELSLKDGCTYIWNYQTF